jgi:diguanylate cyclase (GGDEF)-like protein
MLDVIQSVVRLTAHRDRGTLERAALELIADCVPDARIEMFRCVGPAENLRLLLSARTLYGSAECVPAPWVRLDALPALESEPLFIRAREQAAPVHEAHGRRHVFPLDLGASNFAFVDLRITRDLDRTHIALIQTLLGIYCNQIALLDYGETDALTGLLNRKTYDNTFCQAAKSESSSPAYTATSLDRRTTALKQWIGVIDIDHFKRVNDNFGHLIGDELLLLVAQLMRSTFRFGDTLYRFGGEEFVGLLRAPNREYAAMAFERFRNCLATHEFPRVGCVTVSTGFTQIQDVDLPSAAFERADRAVYYAKQHGRNQVRCFEDLESSGLVQAKDHVGEVELF